MSNSGRITVRRNGSGAVCCDLQGYLEVMESVSNGRKPWTYSGSDSSLSETAGTTLSGGNRAGLTAVRPLWITSITYLWDRTTL